MRFQNLEPDLQEKITDAVFYRIRSVYDGFPSAYRRTLITHIVRDVCNRFCVESEEFRVAVLGDCEAIILYS